MGHSPWKLCINRPQEGPFVYAVLPHLQHHQAPSEAALVAALALAVPIWHRHYQPVPAGVNLRPDQAALRVEYPILSRCERAPERISSCRESCKSLVEKPTHTCTASCTATVAATRA
ncbi:hypothetical protein ON010_g18249 [Phytophthora cinnamomi]|nr:hypothetical protein ON010_g18249 [Phytophthora cinnamomi]